MAFQLPNTTPVPNEIINGWAMKLKGSELKVLLLVARKTLGWIADPVTGMRKEEDWIDYTQLKQLTGLHSQALSGAIDALCSKYKLIQIRDKDGNVLDTSQKRRLAGRRRLSLYYRLNLTTLEETSHYSTTLKNEVVLLRKSKTTKSTLTKSTLNNTYGITKQSFGNTEINDLIAYLKERMGIPILDGTIKDNRRYCHLGLKKFGGFDKMKILIDTASIDKFWATKITSFKQLYYNGVQIIGDTRGGGKIGFYTTK